MNLEEYASYDATGLAALVARGEVTPGELARLAAAAIAAVNPAVNAVVETYPDRIDTLDERTLGDAGFELRRSLRYAHGEGYLRRLAAAHGMTVCRIDATTLRVEQGVPIEGLVVVLRRG